ncbi:hypothetical protein ACFLVF_00245 [Chloroflexota bacterium]
MSQLTEMVEALLDPQIYPDATAGVELMQTQMSFAFLTDEYVYKVKKPVDFGFLDYTTLEKRRFYCQREVELNRRLSPDVYLGVVKITQEKGSFTVNGRGTVIEYAVKMRRLPQGRMMNVLLTQNLVSPEMVTSVADKLVIFHQEAETNESISAFGGLDTITQNTAENFTQTEKYIGQTISRNQYEHIKNFTDEFIENNTTLFQKRIAEGRIRDCHGDLHSAHICLTTELAIYDCIEFNDRFRYCDVASEVAFLAMDLDRHQKADLSRHFVDTYVSQSRDEEMLKLLDFYKCYRAYVRGKVESFQLDDPYTSEEEKTRVSASAKRYFELAESYVT